MRGGIPVDVLFGDANGHKTIGSKRYVVRKAGGGFVNRHAFAGQLLCHRIQTKEVAVPESVCPMPSSAMQLAIAKERARTETR